MVQFRKYIIHTISSVAIMAFKCRLCVLEFTNMEYLDKHREIVHKDSVSEARKLASSSSTAVKKRKPVGFHRLRNAIKRSTKPIPTQPSANKVPVFAVPVSTVATVFTSVPPTVSCHRNRGVQTDVGLSAPAITVSPVEVARLTAELPRSSALEIAARLCQRRGLDDSYRSSIELMAASAIEARQEVALNLFRMWSGSGQVESHSEIFKYAEELASQPRPRLF